MDQKNKQYHMLINKLKAMIIIVSNF